MIDLCTVGDLKWLVVLSMPRIPLLGERMIIKDIQRMLGNDAAIVSLLAARLGLRSNLLATNAIATQDGQPLIDLLQHEGVDLSLVDTGGVTTPSTFLLSCEDSDERTWMIEEHTFHNPASGLLPTSKFAYIDVYDEHIEERLALIQKWSEANVRCLVNLSATHIEEKAGLLARIPSIDTIQIGGSKSVDEAYIWGRDIFQMCNARAVIITLGNLGAVLVDRHDNYYIPAEPIRPLRTIGAGASFTAGYLCALVQQAATYREAVIFASKYAASFCMLEKNLLDANQR
jgi:sugar/nucleoside kinase (ribokinase family)